MFDGMPPDFRNEMIKLGVLSYSEQDSLYEVGKKCAATMGRPFAGVGAVLGAGVGTVTVPGVGAVPGAVAGFLAGLATGTLSCTAVHLLYREEIKALIK